jgi:hypothetical protein
VPFAATFVVLFASFLFDHAYAFLPYEWLPYTSQERWNVSKRFVF